MVNKDRLLNFITKYNLDGSSAKGETSVKVESREDGSLLTGFMTEDRSTLGKIKISNVGLPAGTFGVYNTGTLNSLIKLMQSEFDAEILKHDGKDYALQLKDANFAAEFILADLSIIPEFPKSFDIPEPDLSFTINSSFIDKYTKSFAALPGQHIAFKSTKGKLELVINYTEHSSHNVVIKLDVAATPMNPIKFDGQIFKDTLLANKDLDTGICELSTAGIMTLKFAATDSIAQYYLVAKDFN